MPLPQWKQLSHRRLQAHPCPLSPSNTLLDIPLPSWLSDPIIPRLLSISRSRAEPDNVFAAGPHRRPNHVLINEYRPGQGILPHEDGAAYHPVVATVSLGAHTVLDVCAKGDAEVKGRILQERRSLLVTTGELYTGFLHGITASGFDLGLERAQISNWGLLGEQTEFAAGTKERGTRVSLTFRDVIKVKNLGKGLNFLKK